MLLPGQPSGAFRLQKSAIPHYLCAAMHKTLNWTDLQYVLAVAEKGTLAGAGRALGVSHTTILRRIAAVEETFGVRLFDHLPSGYAVTAAGGEVLAPARELSGAVATLERRLAGRDLRLEGLIRVATLDTLMASLLPRILAAFQAEHPGVELEVSGATALANLSQRDADVAIRVASNPPETLVGRRLASVGMGVCGDLPDDVSDWGLQEWSARRWVAPSAALAETNIARWMRTALPAANIVFQADSALAMGWAVQAGVGVAALPWYLAPALPGLRWRPLPTPLESPAGLWVLSHRDLRRTPRVRAFTDFVCHELALHRSLIETGPR